MNCLVTGSTGFVGSHLVAHLIVAGAYERVTALRRSWRSPMDMLRPIERHHGARLDVVDCDLTDAHGTLDAVEHAHPGVIFHLAAQSYVPQSYDCPTATVFANIVGTLNLLEAVRRCAPKARVVLVTSSEVYGDVDAADLPITEQTRLAPASPYGASKAAADLFGHAYWTSYRLHVVRVRNFTTSGPGRGAPFFDSAWCKQIALMERGRQEPVLKVGNLDSVRTVMDVRDLVRAHALAAAKGEPGDVFNVGGDETYGLREIVEMLRKQTSADFKVEVDEGLLRPADVTNQVPDTSTFRKKTGWTPKIPYATSLRDMLFYWREHVQL